MFSLWPFFKVAIRELFGTFEMSSGLTKVPDRFTKTFPLRSPTPCGSVVR